MRFMMAATRTSGFETRIGSSIFHCSTSGGSWVVLEIDERGIAQTAHVPAAIIAAMAAHDAEAARASGEPQTEVVQ